MRVALTSLTAALTLLCLYAAQVPASFAQQSNYYLQLIVVKRRTANSDEIVRLVVENLSLLPQAVKRSLFDNGVKLVVIPTRSELGGVSGGSAYDVKSKRVVIPEWNDYTDSPGIPMQRGRALILHEIGHVYDHVNGRISFGLEYLNLFRAEEKNVPANRRRLLAYFLESNNEASAGAPPHRPPQECFASLFAAKYLKIRLPRINALKECFPSTSAYVAKPLPP